MKKYRQVPGRPVARIERVSRMELEAMRERGELWPEPMRPFPYLIGGTRVNILAVNEVAARQTAAELIEKVSEGKNPFLPALDPNLDPSEPVQ